MRNLTAKITLSLFLSFLAIDSALLAFSGCAGGPQRVAYNVQAGAQITVDSAMKIWGDFVKQFHPGVDKERAVFAAYNKAKSAALEAIDASELYAAAVSSGDTNSVPALNLTAQAKQQAAASTLADLVNLLQQFGVKL